MLQFHAALLLSTERQFPALLKRGRSQPFCRAAVSRLSAARQFPAFLLRCSFPPLCHMAFSRLCGSAADPCVSAALQFLSFMPCGSPLPFCSWTVPLLSVVQQCCSFPLFLLRGSSCSAAILQCYSSLPICTEQHCTSLPSMALHAVLQFPAFLQLCSS